MQINPDTRSYQGLMTFLSFVGLNVVYLVCCLPLVTIGAATSALFEVTLRYADHERGNLVKDFFPALARNAWRGTVVEVCLLLPALLLLFAAGFWSGIDSAVSLAATILGYLGAAFLGACFLVGTGLVAAYSNTLRGTLTNALLITAAEPLRVAGIVLVPVAFVCLALVVPAFWVLVVTIGASFGAYVGAVLLRQIFARHTSV